MFTGIIDHYGTIVQTGGSLLGIKSRFGNLELGESIAVDGICLTVNQIQQEMFYCDISPETRSVTTADYFKIGQSVNLERALFPTSRMGGHFVMGHVEQTSQIKTIRQMGSFIEMTFIADDLKYIFPKGSIAVNGVSLTINQVFAEGFTVMLIPHTLERTTFATLQENDRVNLEVDMMARLLVEQLARIQA